MDGASPTEKRPMSDGGQTERGGLPPPAMPPPVMPPPAMPPPAMPPPVMPPLPTTRANPAGIAAAFAGASALLISPFLPYADNTTSFARIAQNTMIQHGGWPLIVLGVIAAAAAFRGSTGNSLRGTCLVIGVLAGAFVYYIATDTNLRTLYPILNGVPDSTQPGTVAAVGIGVYVAAVGAGLLLLASFFAPGEVSFANLVVPPTLTATPDTERAESREIQPTAEPTKQCPDCAETILRDAHVCKHCGYRFEPPGPPTA